jgi:hypothetical protein
MAPDEIRAILQEMNIQFEEKAIQDGTQFRCHGGEIVIVYKTGTLVCGGKITELSKPNYFKKDYASPLMKRPKPVTSCTHCRAPGHNIQLANGKCGRMVGTKRCTGTNQSAIGDNDWGECPSCAASGYDGAAQCRQCDRGSGWVFVRDSSL